MFRLASRHSGMLFALIAACGLGAITTQAKLLYAAGGNALTLMLTRFVLSTVVFGLLILLQRKRFGMDRAVRVPLASIGFIWSGAMICYLVAVETIAVSLAVLVFYTYPLLVLGWGLMRGQIPASTALLGLFVAAFAGLVLAFHGGHVEVNLAGVLFASLASLGAAFTFVAGARVASRMSPLVMSFWINAAGLLLILPLLPGRIELDIAMSGVLALLAATLFYLVAILSQFEALARLSAARAAFLLNLEPIVSLLLARAVLGESLSAMQWGGVLLVVAVIVLSVRFRPVDA